MKLNTKYLNDGCCSNCHGQLCIIDKDSKHICYNCGSYYYLNMDEQIWKLGGVDKLKIKTTLGDFLTWATKNNWWLRGFESINRTENDRDRGWGFEHCTSICFVSDEEINKVVPEKTTEEWDYWGR